jgi:hypothetical protein
VIGRVRVNVFRVTLAVAQRASKNSNATSLVPALTSFAVSPSEYSHFLSGETDVCSSAGGEDCASEKPQLITHATIATKAKGSLIDGARFCLFCPPHGNDKVI